MPVKVAAHGTARTQNLTQHAAIQKQPHRRIAKARALGLVAKRNSNNSQNNNHNSSSANKSFVVTWRRCCSYMYMVYSIPSQLIYLPECVQQCTYFVDYTRLYTMHICTRMRSTIVYRHDIVFEFVLYDRVPMHSATQKCIHINTHTKNKRDDESCNPFVYKLCAFYAQSHTDRAVAGAFCSVLFICTCTHSRCHTVSQRSQTARPTQKKVWHGDRMGASVCNGSSDREEHARANQISMYMM